MEMKRAEPPVLPVWELPCMCTLPVYPGHGTTHCFPTKQYTLTESLSYAKGVRDLPNTNRMLQRFGLL